MTSSAESKTREREGGGGVVRAMLDPLSSVRLGITLLVVLFVYCSVGSAGLWYPVSWNIFAASSWVQQMPRQWPVFEMTEYEWFHTPFFVGLCLLICLNIVVTTVRRIPLKVVNLGVWMIHAGVIVLALGSVVYFTTKIEGDAPVFRRQVRITMADGRTLTLPALPDRSGRVSTPDGPYRFTIAQIDPDWPILSGEDAGERAYSVTLSVETPARSFMRQVIDGYPQYTEDVVPGRGRAVKLDEFGTRLIDESFGVALEYLPQTRFWVKDSSALAVRLVGSDGRRGAWVARRIEDLPRYNDYVSSPEHIWGAPTHGEYRRIARRVTGSGDDPLTGVDVRVTGFLRYAALQQRLEPGGSDVNPVITLAVRAPVAGEVRQELAAFDPRRRIAFDGLVAFEYVRDEAEMEGLLDRASAGLEVEVGEERVTIPLGTDSRDRERFIAIGETGWRVRVSDIVRDLGLEDGRRLSLAILEVETPEGERFTRWAFEDAALTRDLAESGMGGAHGSSTPREPDERIETSFSAGVGAPLVIVAGPSTVPMRALVLEEGGVHSVREIEVGEPFQLEGASSVTVEAYHERTRRVVKPFVVPPNQRDRDSDLSRTFAMIRVELSEGGWAREMWLPFHRYSMSDASMVGRGLGRYEPTPVTLPDGRIVELIFTRETARLAYPIALDDFRLTTHVGGYTGEVSSVRDWTSVLRYWRGEERGWSDPVEVATNEPAKFGGLQYFQAFWDAPPRRPMTAEAQLGGLNFTGLGVGNRHGVGVQLAGSTLSVIGMIYAFYVKPIIKRRRRSRVLHELATLGVAQGERVDAAAQGEGERVREDATHSLGTRRATYAEEHG